MVDKRGLFRGNLIQALYYLDLTTTEQHRCPMGLQGVWQTTAQVHFASGERSLLRVRRRQQQKEAFTFRLCQKLLLLTIPIQQ